MHYSTCLDPKKITNPYTREEMYVPCRKCAACLNTAARNWVTRLEQERRCWKYAFFVTLKYDEEHLPCLKRKFSILPQTDYMPEDYRCELYDEVNDVLVTLDRSKFKGWTKKDYDFFNETEKFNYPNSHIIQKFIKLLRYYAQQQDETQILRYFVASELGPTTFRLHHHGLFFTNSQKVCDSFSEILSKSWKCGNFTVELVESSAPSYVAAYLNSITHLPAIYRTPHLRPKTWMSRRPPIGTLVVKSEEISQIFDNGTPFLFIYESKRNENVSVPLWRCLKDRLFPKLPLFDKLSHSMRVAMYGLVESQNFSNYEEFFWYCQKQTEEQTDLGVYLASIRHKYDVDNVDTCTSWRNLYNICRRFTAQRCVFSASREYYVSRIENYYANEKSYKLKSQLEFEQKQSALQELPFLLNLDRCLYDKILLTDYYNLDTSTRSILESFGVDKYNYEFLDYYDYRKTMDYSKHKILQTKIHKDNTKTKLKNDYLERNKQKFSNVYHYYYG